MTIEFWVPGRPVAKGSKNAFPFKRKDGSLGASVVEVSSENLKPWMNAVREEAKRFFVNTCVNAFDVVLIFFFKPPKKKVRRYHTVKPDIDKLTRAVLDALTGVVWDDDSQVVGLQAVKKYGTSEGCNIMIEIVRDQSEDEQQTRLCHE